MSEPPTFQVKVVRSPRPEVAGVLQADLSEDGLSLYDSDRTRLRVPVGVRAWLPRAGRVVVFLPDGELELAVRYGGLSGDLARDVTAFLAGRGPLPRAEDYQLPLGMLLLVWLPIGVMILPLAWLPRGSEGQTLGVMTFLGFLLGAALSIVCFLTAKKPTLSVHSRIFLVVIFNLLLYTAFGAVVLAFRLLDNPP